MYGLDLNAEQKEDSIVIVTYLRNQLQTMGVSELKQSMNKVEWITLLNDIIDNLKYETVQPPTNLGSSEDKIPQAPMKRKPLHVGDLK